MWLSSKWSMLNKNSFRSHKIIRHQELPSRSYSRIGCINTCNTSCQTWGSKYSYHKWPNWNVGICPSWEPSWTDCAQGIWLIMSYEMSSVHRYGHEKGIEPTSAQLNGMTWSSFPWMTSTCVSLDKCLRCCAKSKFLSWLFSDVQSEMLSWERERESTNSYWLLGFYHKSIDQSIHERLWGGKTHQPSQRADCYQQAMNHPAHWVHTRIYAPQIIADHSCQNLIKPRSIVLNPRRIQSGGNNSFRTLSPFF